MQTHHTQSAVAMTLVRCEQAAEPVMQMHQIWSSEQGGDWVHLCEVAVLTFSTDRSFHR